MDAFFFPHRAILVWGTFRGPSQVTRFDSRRGGDAETRSAALLTPELCRRWLTISRFFSFSAWQQTDDQLVEREGEARKPSIEPAGMATRAAAATVVSLLTGAQAGRLPRWLRLRARAGARPSGNRARVCVRGR